MANWAADLKHAARVYAATPVASALAILALAVAMAFVSAFLSLWNDLALQPHPGFEDSGELVTIAMSNGDVMAGTNITLMEDISENVSLVEGVATDQILPTTVRVGTEPVRAQAEVVVARYFPLLRPRLALGRGFEPTDHALEAEPVVVLGYAFWQRHYGGRRNVLGEYLGVETSNALVSVALGRPGAPEPPAVVQHRIVGVVAPTMKGTFQQATELYLPFEPFLARSASENDERSDERDERDERSIAELYERSSGLTGVGRLAQGATVEALERELRRRYTPEAYALVASRASQGMQLRAIAGVHLDLKSRRDGMRQVKLFLGGTVLLALVAGLNASLFLLSRAPSRTRELAIRAAVGATTKRLVRQLSSEALLLVVLAVAAGFLVSLWLVVFLRDLSLFATVRWREVSPVDWRVLGILAGFALLLAVLVSLAPVVGLKRVSIASASRRISARAGLGQRLASTVQLAAAAVVGSVAVAFTWQLVEYVAGGPGFALDDVVVVRERPLTISAGPINFEAFQLQATRRRETLAALPNVDAVTYSSAVPGIATGSTRTLERAMFAPGSQLPNPEERVRLVFTQADPSFADFLGLRLLHGRSFSETDREGVLLNETAARLLFGKTDVVGEAVGTSPVPQVAASNRVVGVLEDVYFGHPKDGMQPMVFMSSAAVNAITLLRTSASPAALRRLLTATVEDGELELGIGDIVRLKDLWSEVFATDRTRTLLTAGGAVLTVLLAALGAYGTQRYVVTAGRREYAIRAALGAGPRALGGIVALRGMALALPGIALGTVLAYITVAALADDYLSPATAPSAVTAVTAAALLALVAAAIYGPSRQARRTAPAPLLREE